MKSKQGQGTGFIFCWILVLLCTIMLSHFIQCQPQNYFKGSQITQLPSKALPRIGRRNGNNNNNNNNIGHVGVGIVGDDTIPGTTPPNSESFESIYTFQIPKSDSSSSYYSNTPAEMYSQLIDEENMIGTNPNVIFILKRIIKDKILRNEEPIGIFRGRNE